MLVARELLREHCQAEFERREFRTRDGHRAPEMTGRPLQLHRIGSDEQRHAFGEARRFVAVAADQGDEIAPHGVGIAVDARGDFLERMHLVVREGRQHQQQAAQLLGRRGGLLARAHATSG